MSEPTELKQEDEFEHINETIAGYGGDSDDEISEESEEMDDETREKQKETCSHKRCA